MATGNPDHKDDVVIIGTCNCGRKIVFDQCWVTECYGCKELWTLRMFPTYMICDEEEKKMIRGEK